MRTVDDIASAIGYQKIWEAINTYTKETKLDLAVADANIDNLVANVSDMLSATNNKPIDGWSNGDDGWWFD